MKYVLMFMLLFTGLINNIKGQDNMPKSPSICPNYNAFSKNAQLEQVKALAERVLADGTIYLNPDKADSLEFLFQRMGVDNGTMFELVRETKSRLDSAVFYDRYQQFYHNLEVEGGGYTVEFIGGHGPTNPCANAFMLVPNILTGINLNTTADIAKSALPTILQSDNIQHEQLVISHNLSDQCDFRLTWKVEYVKGNAKISWIDAHTGAIIKTFEDAMNHNAPTETYGNRFLNDLTIGNTTTLQSPDSRIIIYDFGSNCPTDHLIESEWTTSLIPLTTNSIEWTIESNPATYQALWATDQVLQQFDGIGIHFGTVHVATCGEENAFCVKGSSIENTFIAMGTFSGSTSAIFDAIAHELGHSYLLQFIDYSYIGNGALHEGISDIIGTYIESLVPTNQGVDWIIGDDEPNVAFNQYISRNLEDPTYNCVKTADFGPHSLGQPMGYWYYLVSQGDQNKGIAGLGMAKTLNILLESLNLVGRNDSYLELMQATLTSVQNQFGRCSNEFFIIASAWETICVSTGYADSNGKIPPCSIAICGNDQACEESDQLNLCACGTFPLETYFRWTMSGQKSTEYKSSMGMIGNRQEGGNCLNLIDFPKYPYYPQTITVELYATIPGATGGQHFIAKKQIKLRDCNGDDPTCQEYYDLQQGDLSDRNEISNPIIKKVQKEYERLRVFDFLGRLIYEGSNTADFYNMRSSISGLAILVFYDESNKIVDAKKVFIHE